MTATTDAVTLGASGSDLDVGPTPTTRSGVPPWLVALPVVLGVVAVAVRPLTGDDAWSGLRAGQWLRRTWTFVGPDPFSSFSGHDLVLSEWVGELVASLGYDLAGPSALVALRGLAVTGLAVLFLVAARREAELVPAVVATFVGLFGTSGVGAGPLAGGVVLAMTSVVLWRRASRSLRAPVFLVPLTWLWAGTHASWWVSPALGAVTLLGLGLDRRLDRARGVRMTGVVLACVAVAALTPVGPRLLLQPFALSSSDSALVTGWTLPELTSPPLVVVAGAALLVLLGWMRAGSAPSWWSVGHALLAVALAIGPHPLLPLAACLVVPLVAQALQSQRGEAATEVARPERRVLVLGGLTAVAAVLALSVPVGHSTRGAGPMTAFEPALDRLPAATILLDYYAGSSRLLFAEPQLHLVVDTRTGVFDDAYVRDYLDCLRARPGWQGFVDRSGASRALLPTQAPLAVALQERQGWTVVQRSQGYVLLAAPSTPVAAG